MMPGAASTNSRPEATAICEAAMLGGIGTMQHAIAECGQVCDLTRNARETPNARLAATDSSRQVSRTSAARSVQSVASPRMLGTQRVGGHHTVLSRLRPFAGPFFQVRSIAGYARSAAPRPDDAARLLAASWSSAKVAAILSLMPVEPARFGLCRTTQGHSQGLQPSSRCSSSWRSYQWAQPGQGSCVGGFGDGQEQRNRPISA